MKQFLLFRCSKSDGGSTCSGIHTQQGDGSDLVVQGLKALGLAVLGGELQNVGHVGLLVGLHVAGDDDVLAVSQTVLAGQIVALSSLPASYRYSSVTVEPVVLYTVYSAVVGSAASLEAASELAASEEAAAEEATEEEAAVEDAEEPQAVMPTASAAAAATIAMFLSFM